MRYFAAKLTGVLALMLMASSANAANIGASKQGFAFDIQGWKIEDRGKEKNYAYGLATRPDSQYRFWFLLSKVTDKENDEDWQTRQLVDKILQRFAKNHKGSCEAKDNKVEDVAVDGAAGRKHTVDLKCKDGHQTQAAYVFFHSPDQSYRGFIWIYPNAGQREFDSSVPDDVIRGWKWKQ